MYSIADTASLYVLNFGEAGSRVYESSSPTALQYLADFEKIQLESVHPNRHLHILTPGYLSSPVTYSCGKYV